MPLHAPAQDQQLIQIVDAALDDGFQKAASGWLASRVARNAVWEFLQSINSTPSA